MKRSLSVLCFVCLLTLPQLLLAQVPPAPMNLTASAISKEFHMMVLLQWEELRVSAVPKISFQISRSVDDSSHFATIGISGDTSFVDVNVPSGHTYYYFVRAFVPLSNSRDSILESGPSNIASVWVGNPTGIPRGTISGTVTDSMSGKPVPFVGIQFLRRVEGWEWLKQTWSDRGGHYSALLDTGTYLIRASPLTWWPLVSAPFPVYYPEWFDGVTEIAQATPVVVADSSVFTADFRLRRVVPPSLATVTGMVTDSNGVPLRGALVVFLRPFAQMPQLESTQVQPLGADDGDVDIDDIVHLGGIWRKVLTDSTGAYSVRLESGRSYIAMAVKRGYLPQFFDHEQDPRNADVIKLSGDTNGIDFSLSSRPAVTASVGGTVRDSSGAGVPSRIILIPLDRRAPRFGSTDSVGSYQITHVHAGEYFVLALPLHGYAPAFYKAGQFGVMQWQLADTVSVSGTVTGIDIGVVPISGDGTNSIAGNVSASGTPLPGVNVYAIEGGGAVAGYGITDNSGAYLIGGLPAGQFAIIANRDGYSTGQSSATLGQSTNSLGGVNLSVNPAGANSVSTTPPVPADFVLNQNYPNPFNPGTTISYAIPLTSSVRLVVYNVLGQAIATLKEGIVPEGQFNATWSGKDDAGRAVSSGVYFYKLDAAPTSGGNTFSSIRKMVLLK